MDGADLLDAEYPDHADTRPLEGTGASLKTLEGYVVDGQAIMDPYSPGLKAKESQRVDRLRHFHTLLEDLVRG